MIQDKQAIQEIQNQLQGVNLSPLWAYIDSQLSEQLTNDLMYCETSLIEEIVIRYQVSMDLLQEFRTLTQPPKVDYYE